MEARMGFFGGSDSSDTDTLINQQLQANQAELESKRQNLYDERLSIIKGQGGEVWKPSRTGVSGKSAPSLPPNVPGGWFGGK
jgi:hypothetical protein